jgi:hypothetical protein
MDDNNFKWMRNIHEQRMKPTSFCCLGIEGLIVMFIVFNFFVTNRRRSIVERKVTSKPIRNLHIYLVLFLSRIFATKTYHAQASSAKPYI